MDGWGRRALPASSLGLPVVETPCLQTHASMLVPHSSPSSSCNAGLWRSSESCGEKRGRSARRKLPWSGSAFPVSCSKSHCCWAVVHCNYLFSVCPPHPSCRAKGLCLSDLGVPRPWHTGHAQKASQSQVLKSTFGLGARGRRARTPETQSSFQRL